MLLGGMPRLLTELDRMYEFGAPKNVVIQGGSLVVLRGRLRPAWLQALTGSETLRPQPLGEQVPQEVELTLSRNSQGPRYFPYQMDFFRSPSAAERDAQAKLAAQAKQAGQTGKPLALPLLMRLEFLPAPRQGELDPRFFDFDPGDAEFDDGTQPCLRRLGLMK